MAGHGAVDTFMVGPVGDLENICVTSPTGNFCVNGMGIDVFAHIEDPSALFRVQAHLRVLVAHESVFFIDPPLDRTPFYGPSLRGGESTQKHHSENGGK